MSQLNQYIKRIMTAWNWMLPLVLHKQIDVEKYSIDRFAQQVGAEIPAGAVVLDAGAGTCPYRHYFSHSHYYSTDIVNGRNQYGEPSCSFLSSVDRIPLPTNWVDAIVNLQVLEHVPDPEHVLQEFCRVLRPGGRLYLTAPQGWGLHEEPHHYFNFTRYGLSLLLTRVGFTDIQIKERGGLFWLLGNRLRTLPNYILFQYLYPLVKPQNSLPKLDKSLPKNLVTLLMIVPFYLLSYPFLTIVIPLVCFYLDKLDRRQLYCLGYQCKCCKPHN